MLHKSGVRKFCRRNERHGYAISGRISNTIHIVLHLKITFTGYDKYYAK